MASQPDVTPTVSLAVAAAVLVSAPERTERALDAIARETTSVVFVVGGGAAMQRIAAAAEARWVSSVHDLLDELDPTVSHVWLLHDDARPRRGALEALVTEAERVDASMAGSKVLSALDPTALESVGGATDVFGVPYTGLQPGELDQEQYDVVRDVAFVPGASILVRRDLLRGLQGPDPLLPLVASGIDLAQRARLAGGRVVVVPSSEVLHDGACIEGVPRWRERAGEYRAMFKAYGWLTLLWVVPFALAIDLIDGLARLAMGSPRSLFDVAKALLWNVKNIGSAFGGRSKAQSVRSKGDEELFRFQLNGSVRMREVGEDLTDWLRDRSSGDGAVGSWMERRRGFWQEPGFLAGFLAVLAVMVATRSIISGGLPTTGFALALPPEPWQTLHDLAEGWNPAGLGAPGPIHSAVGAAAVAQLALLGRGALAATVLTVGSLVSAYFGASRLASVLGVGPAGRIGGGLAAALGPAVLGVANSGYWPAIMAIGVAPWAVVAALQPFPKTWRKRIGRIGVGILTFGFLTAFAPFAAALPLVVLLVWAVVGSGQRWAGVGRAAGFGAVALVFIAPALYWYSLRTLAVGGQPLTWSIPAWMAVLGGATMLVAILVGSERSVAIGSIGAVLGLGGVWLARSAGIGTGLEPTAVGFVLASLGLSLSVAAAVDLPGELIDHGRGRRVAGFVAATAAASLVLISFAVLVSDGRAGFGEDRFGVPLAFTEARADSHGPDRVLYIGSDLPGEERVMGGTGFRVASAPTIPLSEAWLAKPLPGDRALERALRDLATSDQLRPGAVLAEFGIKWVVSTGPNPLEQAFMSRLDMKRLPLYEDQPYTVYENLESSPRAVRADGVEWSRSGTGYAGAPSAQSVRLAENYDELWGPDPVRSGWAVEVSGADGVATIGSQPIFGLLSQLAGLVAVVAALGVVISVGGRR